MTAHGGKLLRRGPNPALVLALTASSYSCSCAASPERPRDALSNASTTRLATAVVAPTGSPLAMETVTAAPSKPTPQKTTELHPITWRATQLDVRPTTHLTTGKHRVASIVRTPDGERELVVYQLPSKGPALPQPRASSILPEALQSTALELQLYMGRDDWPRVITVPGEATKAPKYFRYRPDKGWESPTDDQGALAASGRASGYYGVLGHADPELLCVPGALCYEKRTSGWTKRPVPGPGTWQMILIRGPFAEKNELEVWAWPQDSRESSLLRLGTEWRPVPAPVGRIRDMLTWRGTYVALTDAGVSQLTPSRSPSSESPSQAPATQTGHLPASGWRPLVAVTGGTALSAGSSWFLVATNHGVFQWADASVLTPIHLALPDSSRAELGNTCCISTIGEPSARYFIAGGGGVFVVTDFELDQRHR